MIKNRKDGFTIIEIMVAMGLFATLTLYIIQVTKNMTDIHTSALANADEAEFRNSIRLLLSDKRYCRISLAGDGPEGSPITPVVFKKEDIDEPETEGLDVALFLSNVDGDLRTTKKFNGENNPGLDDKSEYGKLIIKSMKLVMNNNPGANYPDTTGNSDQGIIRIILEKEVSKDHNWSKTYDIDIKLQYASVGGDSTILGCGLLEENEESALGPASYQLAIHSQTTTVPSCPANWTELWQGYSLLVSSLSGGYSAVNDLGKIGSCPQIFKPIPFIECENPDKCDFYTPNDYTGWLSTVDGGDEGLTTGIANITPKISRCVACVGSQALLTLHSQSSTIPDCPSGWSSLWSGYSFIIGSLSNGYTGDVDLESPGSCLPIFRPIPLIECRNPTQCDFFTGGDFSGWLISDAITADENAFNRTISEGKISKCSVCAQDSASLPLLPTQ